MVVNYSQCEAHSYVNTLPAIFWHDLIKEVIWQFGYTFMADGLQKVPETMRDALHAVAGVAILGQEEGQVEVNIHL